MTFHHLAEKILRKSDKPLTANEIWQQAVQEGLDQQLNSQGKTPWSTLFARLYVISKERNGPFQTVGQRPKRFYLKDKTYAVDFEEYAAGKTEEDLAESSAAPGPSYAEKDLHPFLAHFAFYHLNCHTKTIRHHRSEKKSYGEWVHPDMVGCVFPIEEWEREVLELSAAVGHNSVQFLSFELKKRLDLGSLREKFFQAVSNSSWANESYLVAAEISQDEDFLAELRRLSAAFGIGVIELDVKDPNSSAIRFPARSSQNLDWETINKLTAMNRDFQQFLKRVRIDLTSNEIRKEQYDAVEEEEELLKRINQGTL
jgi:hypothetical protein